MLTSHIVGSCVLCFITSTNQGNVFVCVLAFAVSRILLKKFKAILMKAIEEPTKFWSWSYSKWPIYSHFGFLL